MLTPEDLTRLEAEEQVYLKGGFPPGLAQRTALLGAVFHALDVVDTAATRRMDVTSVAQVHFGLGETLHIKWLREQLESLPVKGQWHAQARALLRDELFSQQNRLVELVLRQSGKRRNILAHWLEAHAAQVNRLVRAMSDMANLPVMDYATVAVAVHALGQLVGDASAGGTND
jgi:glutamate dehydrogenase